VYRVAKRSVLVRLVRLVAFWLKEQLAWELDLQLLVCDFRSAFLESPVYDFSLARRGSLQSLTTGSPQMEPPVHDFRFALRDLLSVTSDLQARALWSSCTLNLIARFRPRGRCCLVIELRGRLLGSLSASHCLQVIFRKIFPQDWCLESGRWQCVPLIAIWSGQQLAWSSAWSLLSDYRFAR